jgi:regulator of protease activity HflC (stomatin/prohibitin superfamily)
MTSKPGGLSPADAPALEVRTSDGYKVSVDLTIFYHVLEGRANLVRVYYKDDPEIKEKGLSAVAPGILQNKLSELAYARDFYDSKLRSEKIELAREMLNQHFLNQGVEVVDVVIRDFEFPEEYEAAILRKVLAEQLKRVQESLTGAATAEAAWKKIIAEGNRDAELERASGEADAKKLESEGQRIKTELEASGEKAKLLSEAKGKRQLVNALSGPGGKVYVGLEYAKVFEGLDLIVLPSGKGGLNPFNVQDQVQKLEGR